MTAPTMDLKHLVPLRDVERELNKQMQILHGPGASPRQRVRMANLVIFCDTLEQAIEVNCQIPDITAVHPARTIVVIGESGPVERPISARVTVLPLRCGGSGNACVEQVTLHASGANVDRLPFAVRTLLIGDLPTNLWWAAPQPPPLAGALIYDLAENAQQIVYDSRGWHNPVLGVSATATWLDKVARGSLGGRWRVASDLNWRRLKYWRRLATQALDPASAPGAAESATELVIEHGPHAVVQAWELGAWMSRRLGWRLHGGKVQDGHEMSWVFTSHRGPAFLRVRRANSGAPEVHRVRLACTLEGRPGALNLKAEDGQRLSLQPEGVEAAPRTIILPEHTAIDVIGRQLSDRQPDPVFRESMAVAQVMAQSLQG